MKDNFEETELKHVELNDLEGMSYFLYENELEIIIRNWESKIIKVNFHDTIFMIDWEEGWNYISNLYINKNQTELYLNVLGRIPRDSFEPICPYKLYQFVDSFKEPLMEIICRNFEFKVYTPEQFAKISSVARKKS